MILDDGLSKSNPRNSGFRYVGLCENAVHGLTWLTTNGDALHYSFKDLAVRPELCRRADGAFSHSLTLGQGHCPRTLQVGSSRNSQQLI